MDILTVLETTTPKTSDLIMINKKGQKTIQINFSGNSPTTLKLNVLGSLTKNNFIILDTINLSGEQLKSSFAKASLKYGLVKFIKISLSELNFAIGETGSVTILLGI